jgi:phosphoesterase RecJ-like protein
VNVPAELVDYIQRSNDFLIATHFNPEGDALGSSIALHLALTSFGKRSTVFNKDKVPETYDFLPRNDVISDTTPDRVDDLLLLDCNALDRAGLEDCSIGFSAVIDHHKTVNSFGDIRWVLPDAPATGLMVFYLIKALNVELTEDMASNLYAAIGIDTGIFRYPNTTSECMIVASELVKKGADPGFIAERLFNNYSQNRFLLLKETLNSIDLYNGIAVTVVTDDMYQSTGTSAADTENFVNYPLLMAGVRVSVLFRQLGNESWKISLRSKGLVDISVVATAFEGGGHRNAAGCRIEESLADAKEKLLKKIQEVIS